MDAEFIDLLTNKTLILGVAITRIAAAFLVLPLFSNELVPATVRNSIFVSFALIVMVMHLLSSNYLCNLSTVIVFYGLS